MSKKLLYLIVFVLLLGLVTGSAAQAQELLVNPGFESGESPWYISDAVQITISNEDPYSGSYSAKFVGNGTWLLMSQNVDPAQEGVTYDVSGWMKTVSVTTQGQIILQFLDSGWGIISESQIGSATGSTSYTQYSDSLLSPTGTALLRLRLVMPNGTGTIYYDDFSITEAGPPGQASNPSPADSATDVSVDADLSWTAGTGSTSSDVYFGTTSPGAFQGNQTATTFDPGTMANDTTYYWRIDEINAVGTTTGVVWSFTTVAAPAGDVEIIGSWVSGTSHTEESGTSRVLIFTAHAEDNNANMNITSLTYGGQSMTKVIEENEGTGYRAYAGLFILDEAGINAASGSNFVVTWAEIPNRTPGFSSVFMQNVDQTNPVGASASAGGTTATISTSALSTSDGDMVVLAATCGNTGTYSVNNGFTEAIELSMTSADGVAGYKAATGANETPSVTHSNANRQAIVGLVAQAGAAGPQPPGQASNPSPADSATGVSIDADLSWTAGSGSTSSDVYFGTDSTPDSSEFQGNQTATTFDPGTMSNDITYYWRIDEVNAQGTTTGNVWSFTTETAPPLPGQASNPSPANSATGVSITANLSWTAGSGSTSSDVYFGTDSTPDVGEFQGNQTATTYEPGTMSYSTTYYWRIDEVNAQGTTTGNVWSFTTEAAPPLPGQASNPSPANSATDVSITADLSWTAGSNTTSHDVYFGTSSPGAFQGNQTATTYDAGTMSNDTAYYWRIDEINAQGTTTGNVWSFTTAAATAGDVEIIGSWTSGTTHAEEAGTDRALVFIAHAESSADTSDLGSVTYGGQSMTKVVERNMHFSYSAYTCAFILDEAGIDAATSGTFSPSWNTSPSGTPAYTSVFLQNVNQTTLTGATGTGGTTTTTAETPALSTNDGDMAIVAGTCGNDAAYSTINGFTEAIEVAPSSADGIGGYLSATGSNVTPGVSHTNVNRQSVIGFVVQAGTGGPSPPGQASNPSPADSATGVSIDADLSWTAGSGSTSSDVYFGTDSTPDSGEFQGNQTATTFDPGTLSYDVTYYWRIDEINAGGTTTGAVWSFTTSAAGSSMLITSIENSTELGYWTSNGTMSLSTDHVTDGTYSLKIVFGAVAPQATYYPNGATSDISSYEKLKFDVYVEGDTTITTARFWDSTWASYRSWNYLYDAGFSIVEYAIQGMKSLIDTTSLIQFNFVADNALPSGSTIYIDNVRVTSGPADDSWLENTWPGEPVIVDSGTIVPNADFEYGLYSWSSWGQYDGGNYLFGSGTGSGMAKSGKYSIAIKCLTEGRGSINTGEDLSLEAGDWQMKYWLKGVGSGVTMRYNMVGGDLSGESYCSTHAVPSTWTEYTYNFTANSNTTSDLYFSSEGTGDLYIDAVSLTKAGVPGYVPEEAQGPPTVVTTSGNNVLLDGSPFFALGMYGAQPSDLSGTTFNTIMSVDGGAGTNALLDESETYGFMTWVSLTGLARAYMPGQAALAVEHLKNHPALLGWYTCDEPDHSAWNVPPPHIRYMTSTLDDMDANHPSSVLVMAWTDSGMYQYGDSSDIIMADPYDWSVENVVGYIDVLRDGAGPDRPIWAVLRFAWDTEPAPSNGYLYGCAYGAVAHTIDGLGWFSYMPSHTTAWNTLQTIASELDSLSGAITSDTSPLNVNISNSNIHGILKEYNGNLYLITINVSTSSVSNVDMTISGVTATQADVWFESRTESISSGTINDSFGANERHVYVFPAP